MEPERHGAALLLWSTMHGLSVLLTEGQLGRFDRPIEAAKLAKLVSGLLLEGLLPRPAKRRGQGEGAKGETSVGST